jgi:hypothetical protein
MRIHLSTLLLLVGLVAVSIGWVVDRRNDKMELAELRSSRAARDMQIYLGSAMMVSAGSKFSVFDEFDFNDTHDLFSGLLNDPNYQRVLATVCVTELLNIYEHQEQIELVGTMLTGSYDARLSSREALQLLDCDSTDHFFNIARKLEDFNEPEYYPELHDTNSEEYQSLRLFVDDTIAVQNQMYVDEFDPDPRDERKY